MFNPPSKLRQQDSEGKGLLVYVKHNVKTQYVFRNLKIVNKEYSSPELAKNS